MTTQTSRLSIIVDTGNARENIRRLGEAVAELERRGNGISSMMRGMGVGLVGLNTSSTSAGRSVGGLVAHVAQLNIQINNSSRVINNANRSMGNLSASARSASTSVHTLNGAFAQLQSYMTGLQGLLAGGLFAGATFSIANTADTMQNLNSQVKLVTKSHEEYLAVNERLHEMANKNLTDIEATTKLYTNSARALGNLGKSQEQVLTFTNAVSLAMGVGGKSAQEQAAALYQLGQAMQSGVVQGDEFRSLAENAPIMLDLVAESLGKTRGEVRELSKEGKITAEVMYNALANATPKLQEMFDKMPVTMGQSFGVLKNNYKKFVGEFVNETTGISGVVSQSLLGIAKNFENIITIAGGATAAYVGYVAISSTLVTTTIPAMIAGLGVSTAAFYAQGVATSRAAASILTLANAKAVLAHAIGATVVKSVLFAGYVATGATAVVRKTIAIHNATRAFIAHGASVLRSSMSIAGLRANIGLLTRSVLTNTGAFLRGTVAVQAKTLAMGALGIASRATAGTVGVLAGSIKSLGAIINAHPIMFLSTVIFGVVASTEGLQGAMDSLSDTVKVVGSIFGEFITTTGHGLKNGIGSAIDWVADLLGKKSKDGTSVANKAFNDLFGNTEKGFLGILQVIARVFDTAAAGFWGFVDYGSKQFDNMVIKAKNAWSSLKSFFGFGDGYQIPTIEVSFSDYFREALANQKINGMESLLLSHNSRVQANKSLDLSAVDLTVPSQAQTPSSSDKDKDKRGKKDKKDEKNIPILKKK